jgi:hypothetical protein
VSSTPKSEITKENREKSVLPRSPSGEPVRSDDRSQVFPEGFATGKGVSDPLAPPVFWGSLAPEEPELVQHGHEDFWVRRVRIKTSSHPDARKVWVGFQVRGPLGETEHRVAERTDVRQVVAAHLVDPVVQAKALELRRKLASLTFEPIKATAERDVRMVGTHGVADADRVMMVIHPAGSTLLASLTNADAYVVTHEGKVIDVAAHQWPIDIDRVPDFRSRILAPVRHGDNLGFVAGCFGDLVVFKATEETIVPIHDLDPVLIDRSYRSLIGGS